VAGLLAGTFSIRAYERPVDSLKRAGGVASGASPVPPRVATTLPSLDGATWLPRPRSSNQVVSRIPASSVATPDVMEPASLEGVPGPAVSAANAQSRPSPLFLVVPAAKVNVSLEPLFENQLGQLEAPSTTEAVGWWQKRKEGSPIVLAGHLDSKIGPAVFFHVKELRFGDRIALTFDDGSNISYTVRQIERVAKNAFPSQQVYNAGVGEIRLVTCGGKFNRRTGHYEDNVVVFATPDNARQA
jgi:Sortase domain